MSGWPGPGDFGDSRVNLTGCQSALCLPTAVALCMEGYVACAEVAHCLPLALMLPWGSRLYWRRTSLSMASPPPPPKCPLSTWQCSQHQQALRPGMSRAVPRTVAEMGLEPSSPQTPPSVQGPTSPSSFKPKTPTNKGMLSKCCRQLVPIMCPTATRNLPSQLGALWMDTGPVPPQAEWGLVLPPPSLSGTLKFSHPVASSHPEITPQLLLPSDSSGLPLSNLLICVPKIKCPVSPHGPSWSPAQSFWRTACQKMSVILN